MKENGGEGGGGGSGVSATHLSKVGVKPHFITKGALLAVRASSSSGMYEKIVMLPRERRYSTISPLISSKTKKYEP